MKNKEETSSSITSPAGLIQAARQAHPAFKFATAVGGIAALVAVVSNFGLSPAALVFGVILFFGLMFLFVVFARATSLSKTALSLPAQVLIWAFVVLAVATVALLFWSTFFNTPIPLRDKVLQIQSFSHVSLRVYPKPLEAVGEVASLLRASKKGTKITFLGIHFAITTNYLDDELLKALNRGVAMRFLVLAPSKELIAQYSAEYGQTESKIQEEVATGLANIEKLQGMFHASSNGGVLEVRLLEFIPAQRIYWFDYGASGSEAVVVQYAMGVRSSDSPALKFAGDTPLGQHYEASMRWHWEHGVPISQWKQTKGE